MIEPTSYPELISLAIAAHPVQFVVIGSTLVLLTYLISEAFNKNFVVEELDSEIELPERKKR